MVAADGSVEVKPKSPRKPRAKKPVAEKTLASTEDETPVASVPKIDADIALRSEVDSGSIPCLNQEHGENWSFYQGDCVDVVKGIPNDSVHYSVYSIPFKSLYVYSNSERDFGNCKAPDEFNNHYQFLVREKLRVTKPGRLTSIHCMNMPTTIQHHGQIGLEDFRGDIIRAHCGDEAAEIYSGISKLKIRQQQAASNGDTQRLARLTDALNNISEELREVPPIKGGWIFHSEVCIWKDPVTAMQRTKAIGLLHKQIVKDSCMSRMGIPDYVLTFRKPGKNPEPVAGEFDRWIGDDSFAHRSKTFEQIQAEYEKYLALETEQEKEEWIDCGGVYLEPNRDNFAKQKSGRLSIDVWQRFASPVWMDINATRTLQYMQARSDDDERHICPLQIDVVERCLELWSNPGDVVFSPFGGIGTEPYTAVLNGRKGIAVELKESYFEAACRNMRIAEKKYRNDSRTLFNRND